MVIYKFCNFNVDFKLYFFSNIFSKWSGHFYIPKLQNNVPIMFFNPRQENRTKVLCIQTKRRQCNLNYCNTSMEYLAENFKLGFRQWYRSKLSKYFKVNFSTSFFGHIKCAPNDDQVQIGTDCEITCGNGYTVRNIKLFAKI